MQIVITDWALQSYLDLKHKHVFTDAEYWGTIRPDVELLKQFPSHVKFGVNGFWGPANQGGGNNTPDGYKMKWGNFGAGRVELRLAVAVLGSKAYLCQSYVKTKNTQDYREALNLQRYVNLINQGRYVQCGVIP